MDPFRSQWQDEICVLRCQQGERAAFEHLFSRWNLPLWRHAWRLTRDAEAAHDVTQEAWLAIDRGLPGLHDPGAFPAWAFRIVTHKARDWIRREQRRRRLHQQWAEQNPLQAMSPPQGGLTDLIGSLPPETQSLLMLKYEMEFSTEEIAVILELPVGTVKSRLHHTRLKLRKRLEGHDHESDG